MKRILKVVLGLVGIVVLLLVLAAFLLPVIYDKEDLKAAISSEVRNQTGRDLAIAGALDFTVFPWLAVEVSDLSLSNAPGFGEQPFARIGEARIGVALVPLFSKKISVDEVTLSGLELALAVDEAGRSNWEDLAGGGETGQPAESGPGMFSSGRIAGLNIQDANIEFHDRQAGAHYRLDPLSMQTGALGDGAAVPVTLEALIEDVTADMRVQLALDGTGTFDLETEQYSLEDLELSLQPEQAPALAIRTPRLELDLGAQTLQLEAYTAELASLNAEGSLSARNILDDPAFEGSLVISEFSPIKLLREMNLEAPATADPDVLQRASLSLALEGGTNRLSMNDLILELDDSRFTGTVALEDIEQQRTVFQLTADQLDVDRYMAPAGEEAGTDAVTMPSDELKGPEVQGELGIGRLRMAGLEFSDTRVGLAIRDGRLRLHPLTAGFYGGRYQGDIVLDSSAVVPVISLDESIDAITFQQLVAELVETQSLSGTARGHVKLTGRGNDSNAVIASLQGDLGLTLSDGALEGINIWYEIRRGMALYKGLEPPEPEPKRTVFSRMQVAADVADGVISTRQLIGELPFLTVRGSGDIDLRNFQADLGLVAEVRNSPELAEDPLSAELRGKSFPFRIDGSLEDPSLSVDWKALLAGEATDLLLQKLGLTEEESGATDASGEAASEATSEEPAEERSSEDQLKDAATGALFELLKGKDEEEADKDGGR